MGTISVGMWALGLGWTQYNNPASILRIWVHSKQEPLPNTRNFEWDSAYPDMIFGGSDAHEPAFDLWAC